MAVKKTVKEYAVLHYRNETTRINLYFTDGTYEPYKNLESKRALLLLDILRNEKPIYWTEGPDILWCGREPVGEEES